MSIVSVRTADVRQTMGAIDTHRPPGSHQVPIVAEENRQRTRNTTSHQRHLRQPLQYEQTTTLSSNLPENQASSEPQNGHQGSSLLLQGPSSGSHPIIVGVEPGQIELSPGKVMH